MRFRSSAGWAVRPAFGNEPACRCGARLVRRYLGNEYGGPWRVPHAELRCSCGEVVPDWSPDYVWPEEVTGGVLCDQEPKIC